MAEDDQDRPDDNVEPADDHTPNQDSEHGQDEQAPAASSGDGNNKSAGSSRHSVRRAAGSAAGGAAGKIAAKKGLGGTSALVKKSQSDGSAKGDVKDVTDNAAAGAKIGSKFGAHGAAIGAAAGGLVGAAKNKRVRNIGLGALAGGVLTIFVALALLSSMIAGFVGGTASTQAESNTNVSVEATRKSAVGEGDIELYRQASGSTDVQWQTLAAADYAVSDFSGPGDPAFGIDDRKKFNKAADKYGSPELEDDAGRVQTGIRYGQLLARIIREKNHLVNANNIDVGATYPKDDTTGVRQITTLDGKVLHAVSKKAFTDALREMPTSAANQAETIYDHALDWTLGKAVAVCPTDSGAAGDANLGGTEASVQDDPKDVGGKVIEGVHYSKTAIKRASQIIGVMDAYDIDDSLKIVPLMTALQESMLKMYANSGNPESLKLPHEAVGNNYDSVGMFQQRPGAWGNTKQLMDPVFSTRMFLGGPKKPKKDGPPGMLDISGYDSMPPGQLAQKVQVSAFPDAYDKWQPVAKALLKMVKGADTDIDDGDGSTADCDGDPGGGGTGTGEGGNCRAPVNAPIGTPFGQSGSAWAWYGRHTGVDYLAKLGDPIHAACDGKIGEVTSGGAYGNHIFMDLGKVDGKHIKLLYAHMTKFADGIKAGQTVKAGQVIGYVGQTGNAFGPHLHFEVLTNFDEFHSPKPPFEKAFTDPPKWLKAHSGPAQGGDGGGGDSGEVPSGAVAKIIKAAKSQLGTPYAFGGGSKDGCPCDCSSLMQYSFYQGTGKKVELPRLTYDQIEWSGASEVSAKSRKAGDLVFFRVPGEPGWGHVGLYLGGGKMIDDPHTGAVVRIEPIDSGYYANLPTAYRRVKAISEANAD